MNGTRVALAGAVGSALVLFLTGCVASTSMATEPPEGGTVGATSFPSSVSSPAASPMPTDAPLDYEPRKAPNVEGDTIALAIASVAAFCRPTLDYQTWIAELYPFLTQQAAAAYETVDPANVPCTSVTGDGRVRDGDGGYTMRIFVPTDAGEYSVYVHRPAETAPWAVHQITPVGSE